MLYYKSYFHDLGTNISICMILRKKVHEKRHKKPKKNITNLTFSDISRSINVLAGDVWGDVLVISGDVLVMLFPIHGSDKINTTFF